MAAVLNVPAAWGKKKQKKQLYWPFEVGRSTCSFIVFLTVGATRGAAIGGRGGDASLCVRGCVCCRKPSVYRNGAGQAFLRLCADWTLTDWTVVLVGLLGGGAVAQVHWGTAPGPALCAGRGGGYVKHGLEQPLRLLHWPPNNGRLNMITTTYTAD